MEVYLTTCFGADPLLARSAAATTLERTRQDGGFAALATKRAAWWQAYWARVPAVEIPNERLQFLYDYGMYKLAGLTTLTVCPPPCRGRGSRNIKCPPGRATTTSI